MKNNWVGIANCGFGIGGFAYAVVDGVVEKIHEFSLRGTATVPLPQIINKFANEIRKMVISAINEIREFFGDVIVEKIHEFSLRGTTKPSTTNTFNL